MREKQDPFDRGINLVEKRFHQSAQRTFDNSPPISSVGSGRVTNSQSVQRTAEDHPNTKRRSYSAMLVEYLKKLFFKSSTSVVLFLVVDVGNCFRSLRTAHAESTVTLLPFKLLILGECC
jgi:hypothetical protein